MYNYIYKYHQIVVSHYSCQMVPSKTSLISPNCDEILLFGSIATPLKFINQSLLIFLLPLK